MRPDDLDDHLGSVRVDVVESEGVFELPKRQFNTPLPDSMRKLFV